MSTPFFDALPDIEARVAAAPHVSLILDLPDMLPWADSAAAKPDPLQAVLKSFSFDPSLTLAILSDLSRAEVQERVGVPGIVYAGNLGLEISGDGLLFVEPTAAAKTGELAELKKNLEGKLAAYTATRVEDNGLAICVRVADAGGKETEEVRRLIHETLAGADHPFRLDSRANVHQICARVTWSKVDAINWIREHSHPQSLIVYLGSEEHDIDSLGQLREAIIIKVGTGQTPAPYRLESHAEVLSFLVWLKNTKKTERET